MDLSSIKTVKSETGAVMEFKHPETGEVVEGTTITLLGKDSSVYRKILLKRQQAALDRMQKGKRADPLIAEKLVQDSIEDLVAMTVSWEGFSENGAPIPFSREEVLRVYSTPEYSAVLDQVREFVEERSNFFAK